MFFRDQYQSSKIKRSILGRLFGSCRLYFYFQLHRKVSRGIGLRHRNSNGNGTLEDVHAGSWTLLKLIEDCGGSLSIKGMNNIHKVDGSVIFVANHMSSLETFLLPCIIIPNKNITFVVKQRLLEIMWMRDTLDIMKCIGLTRTDPVADLKKLFLEGGEAIKQGKSIVLFPQKTRDTIFHPEEFSSAGMKLAKKFNIPVIPIALKTDMAPNGKFIKDLGPVYPKKKLFFEFGEPIYVEGNGKQEHEKVVNFISQKLEEWKGQ